MRRIILPLATIALLAACTDSATTAPATTLDPHPLSDLGNGYPSGAHDYQLLIIGVPKDKTAEMDNNNGHRIFVQLESDNVVEDPGGNQNGSLTKGGGDDQNHIYLCNSTNGENDVRDSRCDSWRATHTSDFGVIDANATDGDGAILAIPDPCADADPLTPCTPSYAIWARALTPQGSATITLCADESGAGFDGTDDVWCGDNGITLYGQGNGKKAFEITNNLLSMTITIDGVVNPQLATCLGISTTTSTTLNVYLFDNCFENYFWNYDNNGLKLLQLRFFHSEE